MYVLRPIFRAVVSVKPIALLEEQLRSDRVVTTYLYIALANGPIWLFVIVFGFRLNRKKIACFYPLTLIALPVLAAAYQMYGICTFRVWSWGGPREDVAEKEVGGQEFLYADVVRSAVLKKAGEEVAFEDINERETTETLFIETEEGSVGNETIV
ncbi:hypothetical protein HDU98_009022 [Podochytrium sp. JEL0797]|nr:hypothetical protein HDU98_009022 [Podochytrium sp. JEL0797]